MPAITFLFLLMPTSICVRTYEQIISFFEEDKLKTSSVIPFFSMVEVRKSSHQNLMKEFSQKTSNLCQSFIPFLADVEKMGIYRKPLPDFSTNSKATASYKTQWKEIKKKIITKWLSRTVIRVNSYFQIPSFYTKSKYILI